VEKIGMALQVIDRFRPQHRSQQQQAIAAGMLREREELALLAPQQIGRVALWSLIMLGIGAAFFIILNITMYVVQTHKTAGTSGGATLLLWLAINLLGSVLILLVHEGIHALFFLLWGGTPYFGAKLPFALYCSARGQLFPRNYYIAVGLAPFVIITVGAILLTVVAPALASYGIFAWISNFSGAAGDVFAVAWLLRQPSHVLIEDTETGCRAWEVSST
jgi:hypothetical protein